MSENTAVATSPVTPVAETTPVAAPVASTTPAATPTVAAPAGRPKSASTLLIFGLLEKNPDLKFGDETVQSALTAAGIDLSEASFNVKKSQFKHKGKSP